MSYIGRTPIVGNFVKLDAITTSATATYNLTNGGVAYFPQTANNCIVSLNGVIQSPTSAYTISGSTIVFSDALTSADSIDFILVLGDVLAIGTPSDGTVTSAKLASGTTGLIAWQSVQTSGFTAVAGRGYPCNTTSAAFTVTLPASATAGDTIILLDYAGTFDTNKITLGRNGNKIEGATSDKQLSTERKAVQLVYIDATQGWLVSAAANETATAIEPLTYSVDFLVIAGGGGGGRNNGGSGYSGGAGGGAGGYRNSFSTETSGGGGSSEASLTFNPGTVYTVTVGAGGAGSTSTSNGSNGVDSSISGTDITTITSSGGGGGGSVDLGTTKNGNAGGSGGGGGGNQNSTGGAGTANQGYAGGNQTGNQGGGSGGGGAGAVGSNVVSSGNGSNGGNGLASSITGSSVTRGGGGGGGGYSSGTTVGTGGTGGGGDGNKVGGTGVAGTANTGGGGGGGGGDGTPGNGGSGGSGVVILRMPTASYSGTTTGSPTVTTSGADTILVYNSSGTYTG